MFKTMSGEAKLFLGIIVVTFVVIGGAMFFFAKQSEKETKGFTKEELVSSNNYTYGSASASAYLVEFSDFQCPACGTFEPTVEQIREKYKDKLQFVYRHFPLPQHEHAEAAALAAEAAGKQGKFWEMHDQLFAKQDNLTDETINGIVKAIGLNEEQYTKALSDQSLKDRVAKDKADGNAIGVDSTPTFFLNGKKLRLVSPQSLAQEVDAALK